MKNPNIECWIGGKYNPNIECWIGRKYIGDLREIAMLDFTPYVEQGYLATEEEVKEIAQKMGWKIKKTAEYDYNEL